MSFDPSNRIQVNFCLFINSFQKYGLRRPSRRQKVRLRAIVIDMRIYHTCVHSFCILGTLQVKYSDAFAFTKSTSWNYQRTSIKLYSKFILKQFFVSFYLYLYGSLPSAFSNFHIISTGVLKIRRNAKYFMEKISSTFFSEILNSFFQTCRGRIKGSTESKILPTPPKKKWPPKIGL